MKIVKKDKFTIDIPVCYFMPADFKSRSAFYKRLDIKYDIRRHFKDSYRYYSDIYAFNDRKGDCLKMNIKSFKSFGLVVTPTIYDPITIDAVDNALIRLKHYICKEEIKEIQLSTEGLGNHIDIDELKESLFNWFNLLDITIYILEGST